MWYMTTYAMATKALSIPVHQNRIFSVPSYKDLSHQHAVSWLLGCSAPALVQTQNLHLQHLLVQKLQQLKCITSGFIGVTFNWCLKLS